MKKFIVVILSLLYIGSSTGANIDLHYCMGKLADWDWGHDTSKTCGQCGMDKDENNHGCCKDEFTFVKNKSDQKISEQAFAMKRLEPASLIISYFDIPIIYFSPVIDPRPISRALSRWASVAVYLRDCVFLI